MGRTHLDLCDIPDFPTIFPVKDARPCARANDASVLIYELRLDLLDLTATDAACMGALSALCAQHDAADNLDGGVVDE